MATKKRSSIPLADTGIDWNSPVGEPELRAKPVEPAAADVPQDGMMRRYLGDTAASLGRGAVQGVRMLADTAGADNPVSGGLRSMEDYIGSLQSASAKRDQQEIARILQDAEGKGVLDQVVAGAKAFSTAPLQTMAQAAGTSIPTIAAALIPGVGPAAVAARFAAPLAMGAAQGVGTVKASIYDEVKRAALAAGDAPEVAEAKAVQAQAYDDQNTGQIALGGALGAWAGRSGLEGAAQRLAYGTGGKAVPGMVSRVAMGAVAEGIPEAAQGGQEKFASNTAKDNAGYPTDAWSGVAANATMEGLAGHAMGGAMGIPRPGDAAPPVVDPGQAIRATKVPEGGPMTRAANAAIEAQARAADAGAPPLEFTATELPTGKGDGMALADEPDTTALDFEADPRFAGAMTFDNGAAPDQPVFSSKTLADIHIGEQGAMGELEAVEAAPGQWTVKQTDQAANRRARANIEQWMAKAQPMPEERARGMVKDAEAQLGKKMTALPMPDGSGWTVVPTQWVSAPILMDYVEHASAAEQAAAEQADRASKAAAEPVKRAPRTPSTAAVAIDPAAPNTVAQFIAKQAGINTPAARAFVQDYRAGRITDADVLARVMPKKASEPGADERIAAAAAQAPTPASGLILNREGQPFKSVRAAISEQRNHAGSTVVPVPGGHAVQPAAPVEPSDAQAQAASGAAAAMEAAGLKKGDPVTMHGKQWTVADATPEFVTLTDGTGGTRTVAAGSKSLIPIQKPKGGAATAQINDAIGGSEAAGGQPPAATLRPDAESDQDRSRREWRENYDRVVIAPDLSVISTRNIERAIDYATSRSDNEKRAGWDGSPTNDGVIEGLDREIDSLQFALKQRQPTPKADGKAEELSDLMAERSLLWSDIERAIGRPMRMDDPRHIDIALRYVRRKGAEPVATPQPTPKVDAKPAPAASAAADQAVDRADAMGLKGQDRKDAVVQDLAAVWGMTADEVRDADEFKSAVSKPPRKAARTKATERFVEGVVQQAMRAPAAATHKDPGEPAEPVTPAVVREAIKTGVQATDRKPSAMKVELLAEVDQAVKDAPDYMDFQAAVKTKGLKDATAVFTDANGALGDKAAPKGYSRPTRMFRIEGDGVFSVNNTVRQLLTFRAKVESSPGFRGRQAPAGLTERATDALDRRSTDAAIAGMVDGGDFQAALDFADAKGVDIALVKLTKVLRDRLDKWQRDTKMAAAGAEFESRKPEESAPLELSKDGIAGREVPWSSVPTGNEAFQYATGKTETDGREAIYRRRADERGTYGGWRWEADAPLAPASKGGVQSAPAPASSKTLGQMLQEAGTQGVWLGRLNQTDGPSVEVKVIKWPSPNYGDFGFQWFHEGKPDKGIPFPTIKRSDTAGELSDLLLGYLNEDGGTNQFSIDQIGDKHAGLVERRAGLDDRKVEAEVKAAAAEVKAMRVWRGDTEVRPWDAVDLGLKQEHDKISEKRFKTANDETMLGILKRRAEARPDKWKSGDGVGYKPTRDQINRGFQIASVNEADKTVTIRQVADTGLTRTGGNSDRMGTQTIDVGDLVRDRKYDRPAQAIASAAEPATQAAAILDAAAEPPKGAERLSVLKDVKSGAITPDEVAAAYPAKEGAPDLGKAVKRGITMAQFDAWAKENATRQPEQFAKRVEGVGMFAVTGEHKGFKQVPGVVGSRTVDDDTRDMRVVYRLDDGRLVWWREEDGAAYEVAANDPRLTVTMDAPQADLQQSERTVLAGTDDEASVLFAGPIEQMEDAEFEDELRMAALTPKQEAAFRALRSGATPSAALTEAKYTAAVQDSPRDFAVGLAGEDTPVSFQQRQMAQSRLDQVRAAVREKYMIVGTGAGAGRRFWIVPKYAEYSRRSGATTSAAEKAAPAEAQAPAENDSGPAPMPGIGSISMALAQQAHAGTSHVPERRAEQERDSFNGALKGAWDRAAQIAGTDSAAIERITEVFADVADGYRARYTAALQARSRIMSVMIAGGSNFPVRRMEKRNATERKRSDEASEYLERGIKRLIRAARGPIDNSPESELERVRLNLTQREELQEQMKSANVALRKGDDDALADLGFSEAEIADLKKPDFAGRKGFPDYRLTNNNAEIRRLRERLQSAEERVQDAAAGPVETERAGVKIVEDATDDRLRLIFDGKPSEAVREDLKANGFKWSPKNEAWQRQLTDNARRAATLVLDKHYPKTREGDAGNVAMFSRAPQTDSKAFRDWFGDSAVVDADGKPLVVYHGTDKEFSAFDIMKMGDGAGHTTSFAGFFFSADAAVAGDFPAVKWEGWPLKRAVLPGQNLMPVYLSISNPLPMTAKEFQQKWVRNKASGLELRAAAIDAGHDGIRITGDQAMAERMGGEEYGADAWVAFRPEQIKSATGNSGAYGPANPDIRYSRTEGQQQPASDRRKAVEALVAQIAARWANAPEVVVVESLDDPRVPEAVRREERTQQSKAGAGAPEGFFHDGKVYLIAEQLPGDADVVRVLFHESLGHFGLRGTFGPALGGILDRVAVLNASKVRAKAKQYGLDYDKPSDRRAAAEEVLAEMAQRTPDIGWGAKAIAAVRTWLRAHVPGFSQMALSDAEIVRSYLLPARAFVQRGGPAAGGGGVSFSREAADQADSAAFDPDTADIRYSRPTSASAAGEVSAQDAMWEIARSANTPAKARAAFLGATENINRFNLWDKTIGTMLNMARKDKHFARVFEAFQQQQDDTAAFAIEAEAEAVDVLARMSDRKEIIDSLKSTISGERSADLHAVSKAIFSNIEGEQGVKQKVFTDAQLAQDFKLNERQIGQYRQARAAIDQSLDRYAQSLVVRAAQKFVGTNDMRRAGLDETTDTILGRLSAVRDAAVEDGADESKISALDAAIEQIPAIQKTANDLKAAGYSPAMRFGDYAVTATGRDGTVEFFAMVDNKLQANLLRRQLRQEFPTATVTANAVDKESFKIFGGMSPDTVELFAKFMEVDKTEAFKEFVALAASSRSALKHMLERKGVAGFSQKLPQVLSAFITSNSRAAARNLNGEELAAAMKSVQDNARGDVSEQAAKLYNYMQNPTDDGAKIRGFMFAYFMGGSVASALVNLTQPLMMTTPYLHQFAGNKVAAIMVRAAKTAATGETSNAALKAAMVKAAAEGVTDTHEYYQMMQEAGGSGNVPVRAAMKAWGAMFGAAEKFNRKITFAAAFEVAQGMTPEQIKKAGASDAYSFAKRAVDETQGVYARHNRPAWARGTAGALLMTFKQFSISYIEFFMRLPMQQKLIAIALLMMMAGAEGLPFAEDLEDLIDTLGQKMGYATNTKKTLRTAATAALGEAGAQFALHGISGLSGLPMDFAGRLGMGNLFPGTKMFNPSVKDKSREVLEIAGPAGGLAKKVLEAVDTSDPTRAFPSAMANAAKAIQMFKTGQYRDTSNKRVQDVDAMDAAMKLIGFQPQSVAAGSRRITEDMRDVDTVRRVEAEIVSQWAEAIRARDQKAVKDAKQRLADWNDDNPELPIRIKMQQIVAKVKAANLTRDQRFMKTAPPEIRRKLTAEAQ